jgi:CheY-like chemotaxis protein
MPHTHPAVRLIFLADDDEDDCILFHDALEECCTNYKLVIARNGQHLMDLLKQSNQTPDLLFLDLNMPLKNGFECLGEIKQDLELQHIPVIIFSTTAQENAIDETFKAGAHLYICKPNDFRKLREVIEKILSLEWKKKILPFPREKYVHLNGLMQNFFL